MHIMHTLNRAEGMRAASTAQCSHKNNSSFPFRLTLNLLIFVVQFSKSLKCLLSISNTFQADTFGITPTTYNCAKGTRLTSAYVNMSLLY